MRFFYIRHGQSVNNALWEAKNYTQTRTEDPELTETGSRQARILADFIQKKDAEAVHNGGWAAMKRDYFGFTHIYTSLMVRSVDTASAIASVLNIPLVAWPEIHETGGIFLENTETGENQGLPGKPRSYFQKNYSGLQLPETVTEEGWWNRPFEEEEERQERAHKVLADLLERHGGTDDRVAIVSHGGFYMHLMREIFGVQRANSWLQMFNTGMSRLDFNDDGSVSFIYHNRTDHLPENLLT